MTEIYFTLDARCSWIQTTKDKVHYKVCTVTDEQMERVRADTSLCLQPWGARVRVVKVVAQAEYPTK